MQRKQISIFAAIAAVSASVATDAHAQSFATSSLARGEALRQQSNHLYGSLNIYPLAPFTVGGSFANGNSGTQTDFGFLVASDVGIKLAKTHNSLEVGGWYWTKGSASLSEVHTRGFFTPELGLQVGYLQSSRVPGAAYTAFLVYDVLSNRVNPAAKRPWSIETGIGGFFDLSGGRTTSTMSVYVQGTYQIYGRVNVSATMWYLRDRGDDLDRFTVGLGYGF